MMENITRLIRDLSQNIEATRRLQQHAIRNLSPMQAQTLNKLISAIGGKVTKDTVWQTQVDPQALRGPIFIKSELCLQTHINRDHKKGLEQEKQEADEEVVGL
jgi:hypothetical protein